MEINIIPHDEWTQHQCPGTVAIDFETFYTSSYSVRQLGHWAYCRDDRFKAYLVAVTDGERTSVCHPEIFPWRSISSRVWVSHNRDFDKAVFERLQSIGKIPEKGIAPQEWQCSAALCAYMQLPRDLAGAVKAVFNHQLDKTPRRRAKGKIPAEDSELDAPMKKYAAQDAHWCLKLWEELATHWSQDERHLYELTAKMGSRGLAINWEYVASNLEKLNSLVSSLRDSLPWQPAMSLKQFGEACEHIGVTPPKSTSSNDPEFYVWLKKHSDSDAALWVQNMQRIRSANRTARVLESMQARRMPNSRMAYDLKYFGASTGRWSGGGGLNLQNLNRKITEGVDLRKAIIPSPDHVLGVFDYSQIENRVLLYLAGDDDTLAQFRDNTDADAYEIHARLTMGYDRSQSLKDYCEETGANTRQLAKARVLGLGFGCGSHKFVDVARVMAGLELSQVDSQRIVDDFRKSNPSIVQLWTRLHAACSARAGEDYILPLPSTQYSPDTKRYLIYRDVLLQDKEMTATVSGKRMYVYGGLLTENWTQATARDVLASAWRRCADAGYVPVLSVHDELVFDLKESTAEKDLKTITSIMEEPLPWAPHLPLKVDGKLMNHYTK
ncbi:DNA polymerase [Verrucomicrobia bacterium]|nr:DNA polymerase [Verrucomicrobiota bacterium]